MTVQKRFSATGQYLSKLTYEIFIERLLIEYLGCLIMRFQLIDLLLKLSAAN